MSATEHAPRRIAVITVHGTGDTAETTTGEKWFQNGSKFVTDLKKQLAGRGVEADVHPHLWSGANSASEREKGARSLTKLIRQLAKTYHGVHVIGHSHGGNVANDAATMLNWSHKQKRPTLASVTTVGTPFFRTQVSRSEALGAWAFGAMALISMFALLPTLLFILAMFLINPDPVLSPQTEVDRQFAPIVWTVLPIAATGVAAQLFILPLAFRGIARIRRAGRRARQDTAIFAIRHPEDEAISFLSRVESLPIEPFPRWSVLRSSRTAAIVWGVRAVLALLVIGVFLIVTDFVVLATVAGAGGYERPYTLPPLLGLPLQDVGLIGLGALLMAVTLAASPVVFGTVYLLYRLIAGTVGEFAFRDGLNGIVSGALRGLAFGRDGDNRIGDVSPNSHYYATFSHVLAGDVAARMATDANDASRRLFEKYRRGVFSADSNQNEVLDQIAKDALTWDSLVHTTYFDQPEVIELCSAYVGAMARGADPVSAEALREAQLQQCPPRPRRKLVVPLARAAATFAIASGVLIGGAVLATPYLNRDQLAREPIQLLAQTTHVAGEVLQDCEQCPEMVVIGGGIFTMGSPTYENGHTFDEGPMRRVTIVPFAVGRYEITFDQWRACEAESGCARSPAPEESALSEDNGALPVNHITWGQARQYTIWLSQKTGHSYRLLSEAEWEYAARAGSSARYSWGDESPVCDPEAANGALVGSYLEGEGCAALDAAGRFAPNAFGLHDMHGNVAEWVEDCYTTTYFGHASNGRAHTEPDCVTHIVRGNSGFDLGSEWSTRSAYRGIGSDYSPHIGFRVARDL
jgi:formylglycine-generating enzyme required for sulfatase activity